MVINAPIILIGLIFSLKIKTEINMIRVILAAEKMGYAIPKFSSFKDLVNKNVLIAPNTKPIENIVYQLKLVCFPEIDLKIMYADTLNKTASVKNIYFI